MNRQSGMSLLESLIAVALLAIGFMGLQAFYGMAQKSIAASSARLQANLLAEQITEDIASDIPNIALYNNVSLTNCATLGATTRPRDWCNRLAARVGVANTTAVANNREFRRVSAAPIAGVANAWMVTVELALQEGRSYIVIRRRISS